MRTLRDAILNYLQDVEKVMVLFDQKFRTRNPLAAWHKGILPREGLLLDNVRYELHGVGCRVSYPEFDVDFDFAPHARSDGFDLWRLWQYIKQFGARYPEFQDKHSLELEFEKMKKTGEITQEFAPHSQLYFLKGTSNYR